MFWEIGFLGYTPPHLSALTQQMPSHNPFRIVRFEPFDLDLRTGELRNRGVRIRLQEKPFLVLASLIENAGELVTRQQLIDKLWSSDPPFDCERGLSVAINKVRQALND